MAVEVTQNLTEITISQVGIQGPKGEKGDSGEIQDVSGLTTTSSFNEFTQSVDTHILGISTYTGSNESWKDGIRDELSYLEAWTASLDMEYATDEQLYQLYQSTASIHFTTQSLNEQTGSQDLVNLGISIVSGSINSQTSSQDNVNFGISIVTSSIDNHILGVSTQTGSQDLVNLGISTFTGSQNVINTSVDNHILDISTYTGSNELWKDGIRGEVNGIEAYTSSLKGAIEISGQDVNVLGMITAQQFNVTYVSSSTLYQSGSTEFGDTSDDIHTFTGTIVLNGLALGISELMAETASQNTLNTSLGLITSSIYDEISSIDNHILGISTQTGSQDLVNLGISTFTGSQNIINTSVDAHILDISTQTGSQDLVNLGISFVTGSFNSFTSSVDIKNSVRLATTLELTNEDASPPIYDNGASGVGATLTFESTISVIDGVGGLQNGDRILIKDQSNQATNGIYVRTSGTVYTRAVDADTANKLTGGRFVFTQQGSSNGAKGFVFTHNGIPNIGATSLTVSQFTTNQGVVSGSAQVTSLLPSGTVSGSSQITEIAGLQAYTSSLKAQTIVSSSTQIENYNLFALTSSANTFYGNQTISGSLNVSSSVNLSGSVVINQLTYPTADFADGQYGVEVPTLGVDNIFNMEIPKTVYEYVKNDSGVTLPKGTPVHSTGAAGFNTLVIAASASNATTMPATFILAQDLDDEEEGLGIAIGAIQGIDTTTFVAGDPVYVGADGGFTQSKPTGSNLIQNLGIVTRIGVNGGGVVLGAGRSNDVPNIEEGYFWAGNSDFVATAYPTSSFALTASANIFYGDQTITGSLNIGGDNSTIVLPNHPSAPVSPASGSIYFDTTDFHFYGWDGGQWKQLDN